MVKGKIKDLLKNIFVQSMEVNGVQNEIGSLWHAMYGQGGILSIIQVWNNVNIMNKSKLQVFLLFLGN